MASVAQVLTQVKKDHGESISTMGDEVKDYDRIPFGIFPLDLATGGGIPEGKVTQIYGPESSGKTNASLKVLASYQVLHPGRTCAWVDAEHSFDRVWATRMGVNVKDLVVIVPDFAEQVIDIMDGLTQAEDVGLIILDSIGAMVPLAEVDGDAGRTQVGGNAMVVSKMCRKIAAGLVKAAKNDHYPTILLVNQVRQEIGKMHGNPEKYPGGHFLKHLLALCLRTYAKDVMEKAVSADLPTYKDTSVVLKKHKIPITGINAQYKMVVLGHEGREPGDVEDWNTVLAYAKDQNLIGKTEKGNKFIFLGEEYPTLTAVKDTIYGDALLGIRLRQQLISTAVRKIQGLPAMPFTMAASTPAAPAKKGTIAFKKKEAK